MTALSEGTKIQYRKVGRAVVQSHACPPGQPCGGPAPADPGGTDHRYWVLFETGAYRGQDRLVWVRNAEALSEGRP